MTPRDRRLCSRHRPDRVDVSKRRRVVPPPPTSAPRRGRVPCPLMTRFPRSAACVAAMTGARRVMTPCFDSTTPLAANESVTVDLVSRLAARSPNQARRPPSDSLWVAGPAQRSTSPTRLCTGVRRRPFSVRSSTATSAQAFLSIALSVWPRGTDIDAGRIETHSKQRLRLFRLGGRRQVQRRWSLSSKRSGLSIYRTSYG